MTDSGNTETISGLNTLRRPFSEIFIGVAVPLLLVCVLIGPEFQTGHYPAVPDLARNYVSPIATKFGTFYGTPFEGFTQLYGPYLGFSLLLLAAFIYPRAFARDQPRLRPTRWGIGAFALTTAILLMLWCI